MTRITRALDESAGALLAAVIFAVVFIVAVASGLVMAAAYIAGIAEW